MEEWRSELAKLSAMHPCTLSILFRPRLIFLPPWLPVHLGAWVYLHFIIVSPAALDAPAAVRWYILGHEYGHIHNGHTGLHFIYWLLVICAVAAVILAAEAIGVATLLGLCLIAVAAMLPSQMCRRELEADALAARVYGREVVLEGALWMAHKTGTITSRIRRQRLEALGWIRVPRTVIFNER